MTIYTEYQVNYSQVGVALSTEVKITYPCVSVSVEVTDDLIAPVVVPDIDEGVMSYRAALVGSNDVTKQDNKPPITETKVKLFMCSFGNLSVVQYLTT